MKIAVFTDLYLETTGGIPSSIKAQKSSLESLGHQVTIFCPGSKKSQEALKSKKAQNPANAKKAQNSRKATLTEDIVILPTCRHLRPGGAPLARNPLTIEQWVIDNFPVFNQFDLVHVHYEAGASIAGVRLARRFRLPLVQTMHGREDIAASTNIPHPFRALVATLLCWFHAWYLPRQITVPQDNYLANTFTKARMWTLMVNQASAADVVLTPSSHFGKKLKHYGVKCPIFTLSNGVPDHLATEKDWPVRKLKPGQPLKIIWNSRVSKEKRILPFLEAVKLAQIPIELDVYGDGNDLRHAQNFARKNGFLADSPTSGAKKPQKSTKNSISKSPAHSQNPQTPSTPTVKIRFHGRAPQPQILAQMASHHLGVTVSYGFDTQGLTLLEAEATGLPVLYCDPDLGEPLPAAGALLAKSPSPTDLATALRHLYHHPEKIAQMSRAMLSHRHQILQSRQTKRLLKIYQALLK